MKDDDLPLRDLNDLENYGWMRPEEIDLEVFDSKVRNAAKFLSVDLSVSGEEIVSDLKKKVEISNRRLFERFSKAKTIEKNASESDLRHYLLDLLEEAANDFERFIIMNRFSEKLKP